MTRSNKGQNEDGVPIPQPQHTAVGGNAPTDVKPGKSDENTIPKVPSVSIPLIEESNVNITEAEKDLGKNRLDKILISQMNLLTGTINTMNLQFHVVQQEITQMNETLNDLKEQQFQMQIQQNREDLDKLGERVTEVEASITFNDNERAAIKDHIKLIEQRQLDTTKKLDQLASSQPRSQVTCDCATRIDQIETDARRKNIIIAGVTEFKNERSKHLTLEILSNTGLQITPSDIEQAVRVGPYRAKGPSRPILVKFKDIELRNQVLAQRHQIKYNPNCSKIWINEDLSEKSKKNGYELKILGDLAINLGHQVLLKGNTITIDNIWYNEHTLNQLPPHLSLKRAFARDTPNGLAFHSEHSFLSSFHPAEIEYNRHKYTSAEQGIQHIKAKIHNQDGFAHEIMQTNNPIKIKRIGDKIVPNEQWKKSQDKWAEVITYAKFDQNPHLARDLANTKQSPLLECTQSSYWGIGMPISHPDLYKKSFQPKGKNKLGQILEKKREDIQRSIAANTPLAKVNPPPLAADHPLPSTTTTTTTSAATGSAAKTVAAAKTPPPPPPIPPRTSPPPAAHRPNIVTAGATHIQPLDFSKPTPVPALPAL